MYNYPSVDVSTARRTFSKIIDKVFLSGKTILITKRNIPVAQITKIDLDQSFKKDRSINMSLFGILKSKKTAVALATDIRRKVWKRN